LKLELYGSGALLMEVQLEGHFLLLIEVFFLDQALE
jgi:hypothetical protein